MAQTTQLSRTLLYRTITLDWWIWTGVAARAERIWRRWCAFRWPNRTVWPALGGGLSNRRRRSRSGPKNRSRGCSLPIQHNFHVAADFATPILSSLSGTKPYKCFLRTRSFCPTNLLTLTLQVWTDGSSYFCDRNNISNFIGKIFWILKRHKIFFQFYVLDTSVFLRTGLHIVHVLMR